MDGIGVAEQVVHVAQNFLVSADQKGTKVVILSGERVKGQRALHVATVDELVHLAIGIARDVAQDRGLRRLLVKPVNRHDREQLFDRPAIRHALEQREIAKVGRRERCF